MAKDIKAGDVLFVSTGRDLPRNPVWRQVCRLLWWIFPRLAVRTEYRTVVQVDENTTTITVAKWRLPR